MPLWRLVPVADRTDSRWQDRRIRHDVVVRAPSAAMARLLAADAEPHEVPSRVGNEARGSTGGFDDPGLYWVQRLGAEEARAYGGEDGPMGMLDQGRAEEPALSVLYAPSVAARARRRVREAADRAA